MPHTVAHSRMISLASLPGNNNHGLLLEKLVRPWIRYAPRTAMSTTRNRSRTALTGPCLRQSGFAEARAGPARAEEHDRLCPSSLRFSAANATSSIVAMWGFRMRLDTKSGISDPPSSSVFICAGKSQLLVGSNFGQRCNASFVAQRQSRKYQPLRAAKAWVVEYHQFS